MIIEVNNAKLEIADDVVKELESQGVDVKSEIVDGFLGIFADGVDDWKIPITVYIKFDLRK